MSEQINSGRVTESEISPSGLLLSVEPLGASEQLDASDGNADTGGAGEKDTSDDTTQGTDTDLTDSLGADTDGSDDTADADGSDDSDAEIKIDGKRDA